MSVLGKNIFAGGLLPYTSQATDALFDGLRQVFRKKGAKKLPAIADQDLQLVASMFTLSWLIDTLDRAMGLPPMQNSDGDDLMFHDARFPLVTGVTQEDIATRVNAILAMAQENVTSTVSEQPTENLRASLNSQRRHDVEHHAGIGPFFHLVGRIANRDDTHQGRIDRRGKPVAHNAQVCRGYAAATRR